MEHMGKLLYLEWCLRETLRLHPAAPSFSFQEKGDQVLADRYKLQNSQVVSVFLTGLHRDKALFETDADTFKPERMVGEEFSALPPSTLMVCNSLTEPNCYDITSSKTRLISSFTCSCLVMEYEHVSVGPLLGRSDLTVGTLLQYFNFTKDNPSHQLEIKTNLTIKSQDFYMKARLRDKSFLDRAGVLASSPASVSNGRSEEAQDAEQKANLKPMQILFGSSTGTCETALAADQQPGVRGNLKSFFLLAFLYVKIGLEKAVCEAVPFRYTNPKCQLQ
ncbi:hypothetical protein IL306_011073 [Fusarium sp. DS 682]|nr:hypothetical protein IL306_011073 [Fusarium sp. DS 682]